MARTSSGQIRIDGRRIEGLPPHRRNIGMVFPNYAIFPNLSVAGNIVSMRSRASRLDSGSSSNSTSGRVTSARAMATRCGWPPES